MTAVLRRLRERRGLSKEALAHAAQLTVSGYNRIEGGTSSPGWSTVRKIADALDVPLAELGRLVEAEERLSTPKMQRRPAERRVE